MRQQNTHVDLKVSIQAFLDHITMEDVFSNCDAIIFAVLMKYLYNPVDIRKSF